MQMPTFWMFTPQTTVSQNSQNDANSLLQAVEMQQATGFQDNVGVTVVMPGEDIRQAANNEVGKSIELPIEQLTCSI